MEDEIEETEAAKYPSNIKVSQEDNIQNFN